MATPDFDIGKQASLSFVANGAIVDTVQVTEFNSKQETITLTHRPLSGPRKTREIPDGWTFTFGLDRLGPTFDDYFANDEETYWSGGPQAQVVITETIQEKDGSVSQYRFEDVCLKFDDTGDKKQDDMIKQKVSGYASRRRRVA